MNKARGQGDRAGLGVAGALGARPVSASPAAATPMYKPPSGLPVSAQEAARQERQEASDGNVWRGGYM